MVVAITTTTTAIRVNFVRLENTVTKLMTGCLRNDEKLLHLCWALAVGLGACRGYIPKPTICANTLKQTKDNKPWQYLINS